MVDMRLRVGCNPGDAETIKYFVEWILNIGDGKIGGKNDCHSEVVFTEEMLIPDSGNHVESIIKETYENWQEHLWDPSYFQDRDILTLTHEEVDKINSSMMFKLDGTEKVYYSSDTVSLYSTIMSHCTQHNSSIQSIVPTFQTISYFFKIRAPCATLIKEVVFATEQGCKF